jgi:hypothetical protein
MNNIFDYLTCKMATLTAQPVQRRKPEVEVLAWSSVRVAMRPSGMLLGVAYPKSVPTKLENSLDWDGNTLLLG